jgi:hypothetical protein
VRCHFAHLFRGFVALKVLYRGTIDPFSRFERRFWGGDILPFRFPAFQTQRTRRSARCEKNRSVLAVPRKTERGILPRPGLTTNACKNSDESPTRISKTLALALKATESLPAPASSGKRAKIRRKARLSSTRSTVNRTVSFGPAPGRGSEKGINDLTLSGSWVREVEVLRRNSPENRVASQ